MHISKKLELLSSTRITSGVSFESIVKLNKRYSAVFEKMTLGFECEIAIGNLDISDDGNGTVDIDSLRENFNENFEFSEQSFLNIVEPEDIIKNFEVEPKYGDLPVDMEADIDTVMTDISKKGYAIAYGTDKTVMFRPTFISISNMRDFTYNDSYNVDAREALQIGMTVKKIIDNFVDVYKIDKGVISRVNTPFGSLDKAREDLNLYLLQVLQYVKTDKPQVVEESSTTDVKDKVNNLKKYVWMIGYNINNIDRALYRIRRVITDYNSDGMMVVKTDTGAITCININHYDEQGLLSPYITFNKDEFKKYYEIETDNERDRQWESELEDAQSQVSENNSGPVAAIHRIVLSDVDEGAERSDEYHSDKFNKGRVTVVEPDSSISPAGAEVVSKVFVGPKDGLEWLEKVFNMIEDNDLQTNKSTGLHVNIGTFRVMHKVKLDNEYGINQERPVIDVLKLAILSGDHYLLDQFDRHGNTYAQSLASNIIALKDTGFDLRKAYKTDLFDVITNLNRTFINNQYDRYRTINMQHLVDKGYLEFRIAGGVNYHQDMLKVKKAIYRYMQLCAIACDPQAYFKEYMTELYQWFVDKHNVNDPVDAKQPRPKTAQEALHVIRLWNSKHSVYGNGPLNTTALSVIIYRLKNSIPLNDTDIIDVIAGLDTRYYTKVDTNLLYSFRLLLVHSTKSKPNGKQYLTDIWNKQRSLISDDIAPKMYRNKPQWLKFFFTGTGLIGNQRVESNTMNVKDKVSLLANTRVEGARLYYYSNRSTPEVVKNGQKPKPKAGYGKVVKTRKATKEEEAQLRKGKWIRTRHDNKKPGDKGAKRSSYRPQLGKKQKVRAAGPDDATTYILKVNDSDKSILKILEALKKLGDEGSSRSVTIEDDENKYIIDGDGADKIYDIEVQEPETIEADVDSTEATAKYSYDLNLKVREFNKYGTIENMLTNIKDQTDIGLLTTVVVTSSNGFIGKFVIGEERQSEVSKYGPDTIISIDKVDNPEMAYENPEPEDK